MAATRGVSEKAGPSRGVIALRISTFVVVFVAAYLVVVWFQLGAVIRAGDNIESRLEASTVKLNTQIDSFRGDPTSAESLLPTLTAGRAQIAAIARDAASVQRAVLPPFGGAGAASAAALAAYGRGVDGYYAQLAGIAQFVVDRSAVIAKAGEGLSTLTSLAATGTTEADVKRVIGQAHDAVAAATDQLRSLASTATSVYSSDALLARLSALSDVLGDIETGLAKRDASALQVATQAFSRLMQADWQTLFFLADDTGLENLTASITGLSKDRSAIDSAREDVAMTRTALGSVAVGLIVIALFMAGVAWLR
jgi:hypothetical protein